MLKETSIISSNIILSVTLLAGRVAGFARESILASSYGLTHQADMAIVMLTLPDLLVNLLLSGGLSVALIPVMRQASKEQAIMLFLQASAVVLLPFLLFGLLLVEVPELWFSLLSPGLLFNTVDLSFCTLIALALAISFSALSGVSTAALNASGRFFVAGSGTLIFNLCIMVALWINLQHDQIGLEWLALGIASGGFLRWISQLIALVQAYSFVLMKRSQGWMIDMKLIRTFGAGLTAASLLILVPVSIRGIASCVGEGELVAFNYAIKLVELPLGVLITTLATVAYPKLSQANADRDDETFIALFKDNLSKSFVLSMAVVICGWQFVDSGVHLLLGFGRVNYEQQVHIIQLTKIALLSVPLVGVVSLMTAAMNARDKANKVLLLNFCSLLFLPLLALPGLFTSSATLLMLMLPAFYLVLTGFLYQSVRLPQPIVSAITQFKIITYMIIMFMPFIGIDLLVKSFAHQSELFSVLRIILGFLSWLMLVYVGFKILRQSA